MEPETRTEVQVVYLVGGSPESRSGGEGKEKGRKASMCCNNELVLLWAARKSCRGRLEEPCRTEHFCRISQNGGWEKLGHLPADPHVPVLEGCS